MIKVPPQKPIIMDQTGKRIVGEALGQTLNQGQTISLDCLVNGGKIMIGLFLVDQLT